MKHSSLTKAHNIVCTVSSVLLLLLAWPQATVAQLGQEVVESGPHETISLDEIERGMRGHGVSVFAGTELRRFEVEVVGKLENLNPGLSFIMANLSGEKLEETGVIGGMSGSPVYLDGKLAGAVAFSWNFAQGALAGITPIAAMRGLGELPVLGSEPSTNPSAVGAQRNVDDGRSRFVRGRQSAADSELEALLAGDFSALYQRQHSSEDLRQWMVRTNGLITSNNSLSGASAAAGLDGAASALQLLTVGFDQPGRELLGAALPESWQHRLGSSAGRADTDAALPPLEGGGPVAALLVGGDLLMAVNGTVTERRGDEILAFGHPYLGLGPVSLPMAKAEVVAIVSSRMSSFKLSNVGEVVGAFDEDRLAGMRGRVGAVAKTTPLSVTVRHSAEGERVFNMQLADLEAIRPMLVASSTLQCIESATRSAGKGGFDLRAKFALKDRDDLEIAQSFDGSSTAIDAAIYLLQVTAYLELSSLVDVELEKVEVEVDHFAAIRTIEIENVFADRRNVEAGEMVELRMRVRDYRGPTRIETLSVQVPEDARPGRYYIFVGDGVSVDAARAKVEPTSSATFEHGLDRLRQLRSAKELVAMGVSAARGVISDGTSLPSLPGSLREVWKTSNAGQVKGVNLSVQSELVIARDRPLSGVARVDLVVLPPRLHR